MKHRCEIEADCARRNEAARRRKHEAGAATAQSGVRQPMTLGEAHAAFSSKHVNTGEIL